MSLTYCMADTHGRYDLVEEAFLLIAKRIDAAGVPAKIVVMGDFVDRGPASQEIIRFLIRFQRVMGTNRFVVLQGNHEAIMLEVLRNPTAANLHWWMVNGGDATLRSYGYQQGDPVRPLKIPAHHVAWLDGLPATYEDEHRIYVHAGVPADQEIADTARKTLQWMLYAGGESYRGATIHPDQPHRSGKHIVHGHEQSASHPLLKPHRTNLDSWAYHTGALAIGVFDDNVPGGPIETLWAIGEAA